MSRFRHLTILTFLATLLVGCPPKGGTHYNNGVAQFKEKKYPAAITAFEKAIASNPDFSEAYLSIGLCYYQLKQYDKARAYTQDGIDKLLAGKVVSTKDEWTVQQKTALGHWHLGLISEDLYRQAITKDNKAAILHLKQARTDYQKAAKLDSGNEDYSKRVKLTDDMLKKLGT